MLVKRANEPLNALASELATELRRQVAINAELQAELAGKQETIKVKGYPENCILVMRATGDITEERLARIKVEAARLEEQRKVKCILVLSGSEGVDIAVKAIGSAKLGQLGYVTRERLEQAEKERELIKQECNQYASILRQMQQLGHAVGIS
jgi:hypothetical protein